jgi:hypothetical protein
MWLSGFTASSVNSIFIALDNCASQDKCKKDEE